MKKYRKAPRKRVRSRAYTKINKDLSIRGGFVGSMPRGKMTPQGVYKTVAANLGTGPSAISNGRAFISSMASAKAALDVAGATIDVVGQVRALGQAGNTTAVSRTTSSGLATNTSAIGRKFKTTFDVGRPSTRIVNEKGRTSGTRKLTQFDTSVQNLDPTSPARTSLTMTTGANQKFVYAYDNRSYWTMKDLEDLTDASVYNASKNQSQKAYWLTKYFGVKYRLMNTNKYLKVKVKVHWLKSLKTGFAPKEWVRDCTKNDGLPGTENNIQWIPYNTQLTTGTDNPERFGVGIDPQLGSMNKSKLFGMVFQTVKTFTKTMEPGESWEIDYKHHTGPGIRLNDMVITKDSVSWAEGAAAFYYPMFEIVGVPVEVVNASNRDSSFIATSSGAVQLEMKKYCEIVNSDLTSPEVFDAQGGYERNNWAYRVFTDYSTTATESQQITRRFNIDYNNILKEGEADAAGKYIIPITTELQKVRAGKSNDGA